MKNKFIFRLLPLIAFAIALQSCRTNEDFLSAKEESYYSNKFQVFTSLNNKPVDYAKGFSILFEKYDSIHGTSYTRAALLKKGNFNKNDAEFVEFNLRSQEMLLDDGERWIVYPIIKNNQVGGLMVGILRNEETEVEFRTLDSGSSYYTEVIEVFRMAFMKSNLKQRSGNTTSRCGFDGSDACDIEEVIISPPPRPRPGGGGPKGGCTGLNNCMNPDIGGGGGPGGGDSSGNEDPCVKALLANSKAKELLNKSKISNAKNQLTSSQATDTVEKAFFFGKDANGNYDTSAIVSSNSGSNVSAPISPNFVNEGAMHTHLNGFYNAFSNADIYTFQSLHANNPNFNYYFAAGADGSLYLFTITDPVKYAAFVAQYPFSANIPNPQNGFAVGTSLYTDFENAKQNFQNQGFSVDDAFANATAYILNKYDTGTTLSQQDATGNFNSKFVDEKILPPTSGQNNPKSVFTQTPDCNLK